VTRTAGVLFLCLVGLAGYTNAADFSGYDTAKAALARKDYATALSACRPDAERDEPRCQNLVGVLYRDGLGVPKDSNQAVQWYRRAAAQGNAKAQSNLALAFYRGDGVPKDFSQAFALALKSADQGWGVAQFTVGYMYSVGEGVTKDDRQAVAWLTKVSEQTDPEITQDLKNKAARRIQELGPQAMAPQAAEPSKPESSAAFKEKVDRWAEQNKAAFPALVAEIVSKPTKPSYETCKIHYSDEIARTGCLFGVMSGPTLWSTFKAAHFQKTFYEIACLSEVAKIVSFGKKCEDNEFKTVYETSRALLAGGKPRNCGQHALANLTKDEFDNLDTSWAVLAIPKGQRKKISGELTNFNGQRLIIRESQMDAEMDTVNSKGMAGLLFSGGAVQNTRKFAVVLINSKTTVLGSGGKLTEPLGVVGIYKSNENLRLTDRSEMPASVIQAECIETP